MSSPAPAEIQFKPWKYLGIIALLFVLTVLGWTWFLLRQNGALRDYVAAAMTAASARADLPAGGLPCADLTGQALPKGVERCTVRPATPSESQSSGARLVTDLELAGGRRGTLAQP